MSNWNLVGLQEADFENKGRKNDKESRKQRMNLYDFSWTINGLPIDREKFHNEY